MDLFLVYGHEFNIKIGTRCTVILRGLGSGSIVVNMYKCVYINTYLYMFLNLHICTYVYTYLDICLYILHMHISISVYVYIY